MVDLAGSPLRPRWTYNDGSAVDYLMSVPQRPWDFGSRGIGGSDTSAAGVPAAFEIRRDYLLHLTLRFPVSEWDDVARLVRHLQRAGSVTLYPDQDDTSVSHLVYGDSPAIGEEIRPRRSSFPSVLELDVSVRRTTSAIFTDPYYGDLLLYWQAGETGPGSVFTRSGTAYYIDQDGVLRVAATGVRRTEWTGPGFGTPTLLLEDTRTNGWTFSEQLDNAVWSKANATVTPNDATAPDGFTTMDKIVEDSTASIAHYVSRNPPALTDDTNSTFSFYTKAGERGHLQIWTRNKAGTDYRVVLILADGTTGSTSGSAYTITSKLLPTGVYRWTLTFNAGNGGTSPFVQIRLQDSDSLADYNGDGTSGAYVWGIQFETDRPFASSYIQTVASTVTRNAETLSFVFPFNPREMTAYIKFIERGTGRGANFAQVWKIGSGDQDIEIRKGSGSNGYEASINTSSGVTSTTGELAAPTIGQEGELRLVLSAAGALTLGLSIDGGTETVATASATADGLPSAWGNSLIVLATNGFTADRSLKIARGTKTLAQMRVMSS